MLKNTTGQHLSFIAIATADGSAVTSGTPVVHLSKDGAAQATSTNTASHLGNGVWVLDLTKAETDADHLSAVMVLTNAVNSFAQAFPVVQADFKAERLFEFPSTAATANSVSSVATVSPLIISAKKIHIHLRYSSTVDNTPDANTHREIALQPPTPVNTSTAPAEINLKTYFGSDNRYSISNEISSAEIDITSLGLEVLHGDWTIIIRDNQGMGYNQQVLGASIEFSPLPVTIGDATAASQTSISNAISALNDFDPAADTVANVTTVGSVTGAVTTSNASDVTAIKAKTDQLAFTLANKVDSNALSGDFMSDSSSLSNFGTLQGLIGSVGTDVLALNDFDPATQTVTTDAASRTASQADVSSLATAASVSALNDFDPTTQTVTTDAASRTASQADVSSLATTSDLAVVDSNVDAIKVKTDQMVFSNANELDCNAVTGGGGDDAATIYSYFTASSRQNTFRADVSSLATAASVSALNDFDPATQTVTTDTASRTASQADVSSLATAASISALNDVSSLDIYNYFTASNRQDTFKATGFATVNPDNTSITAIKAKTDSLTFTIANQVDANALTGGGSDPVGSGAVSHTVTVNIDNVPANAVDVWVTTDAAGANVVAGTLVTNQAGQATFQLDAGSYYLWCQRSGVNFTNPTAFTVS